VFGLTSNTEGVAPYEILFQAANFTSLLGLIYIETRKNIVTAAVNGKINVTKPEF